MLNLHFLAHANSQNVTERGFEGGHLIAKQAYQTDTLGVAKSTVLFILH